LWNILIIKGVGAKNPNPFLINVNRYLYIIITNNKI